MIVEGRQEGAVELEGSVLDTFEASEGVAHVAQDFAGALDQENLEALVGFQVNQLNGDDFLQEFVLEVGDAVLEVTALMFVDERQHAHHHGIVVRGIKGVHGFGDDSGDGLRAVRKAPPIGQPVQTVKGFIGDADSNAAEVWIHSMTNLPKLHTLAS